MRSKIKLMTSPAPGLLNREEQKLRYRISTTERTSRINIMSKTNKEEPKPTTAVLNVAFAGKDLEVIQESSKVFGY